MNKFILALAATAAFTAPALAMDGDSTSRLDVPPVVQNVDGMAPSDPAMEEAAGLTVTGSDSFSRRGPDVNERPYNENGDFRF